MRTTLFQMFCLLITGIFVLSACNLPGINAIAEDIPPTEQSTATATATIDRAATQTRQAELAPTETPTATATETLTPEPSATATPEAITAEVVRESNCRIGPAGNYDLVAKYQVGQMLEVIANDLGAGYIFVKNPEKPEDQCYLLTQNIKISGDASVLPRITPLPSPTAAPYFNFSFKKFDKCKGTDFALFIVENVGSIPFRSFYIRVTNSHVGKSVEQVLNAFDLWTGCIIAKNIAPLNPGETGYASSPLFKWESGGDELQTVLMLCTEKNLKGTCVTQSMIIK